MEYDGNTRKVLPKNVVLTDPKGTTIKTETMYYDRLANQAYYNTGGTINDGKSTMYSKSATYFLTTVRLILRRVKIVDREYTLKEIISNRIRIPILLNFWVQPLPIRKILKTESLLKRNS
jgi:hypothetical protein